MNLTMYFIIRVNQHLYLNIFVANEMHIPIM